MDIGSLFLIFSVFLIAAFFVIKPLFDEMGDEDLVASLSSPDHDFSIILAEKDRIITMVDELDQDYELGKIEKTDWQNQRARLLKAGAVLMEKLEKNPGQTSEEKDRVEELISQRKNLVQTHRSNFCSQCGAPLDSKDKFCSRCGHKVIPGEG